jgi:hypothetical protein
MSKFDNDSVTVALVSMRVPTTTAALQRLVKQAEKAKAKRKTALTSKTGRCARPVFVVSFSTVLVVQSHTVTIDCLQ